MTRKLLTVDEFRASARDGGAAPEGTVTRLATSDPEAIDETKRTIRFVFSDGSVDRSGDAIDPKGWEIDAFLKNPVALWAHASYAPPIGRASNVGPVKGKLMGDIEFMTAEISPFADSIFRMVTGGFIKAVSVGFIPLEYAFVNDKDRPWGIDFKRQELLEISVCPIPCNPNALQEARSKGIDTTPLREWAEMLLDDGASIRVPRAVLEETFRLAKTPHTVRQRYLSKAEAADWQAGAARDLPTDETAAWDGPAAAKRMLDDAGFDGDAPDAVKAARGFLIHDAANPTLRSSYKLPFADIVDGELRAIKGGVAAAQGRLDQTEAPAAVLDDAKAIAGAYEFKDAGDDMPAGNCGRKAEGACGMTDPAECSVHAPAPNKSTAAPVDKAGRRISSANEALLRSAMDHHESATKCIKDVLASNATEEPDEIVDDLTVPLTDEAKRAKRIREAKALRASLQA